MTGILRMYRMRSMPRIQRTKPRASGADRELGALLLLCRAERDLTLADVAPLLKMTLGNVAKIERGERGLSRRSRLRLSEFLRKHGYFPKSEVAA